MCSTSEDVSMPQSKKRGIDDISNTEEAHSEAKKAKTQVSLLEIAVLMRQIPLLPCSANLFTTVDEGLRLPNAAECSQPEVFYQFVKEKATPAKRAELLRIVGETISPYMLVMLNNHGDSEGFKDGALLCINRMLASAGISHQIISQVVFLVGMIKVEGIKCDASL